MFALFSRCRGPRGLPYKRMVKIYLQGVDWAISSGFCVQVQNVHSASFRSTSFKVTFRWYWDLLICFQTLGEERIRSRRLCRYYQLWRCQWMCCFRIASSKGWKKIGRTPHNRTLAPLRTSFSRSDEHNIPFYSGVPLGRNLQVQLTHFHHFYIQYIINILTNRL